MRQYLAFLLVGTLVASAGCSGKHSAGSDKSAMATDSLVYTDSVAVGNCMARAEVQIDYPSSGNPETLKAVRSWIAGFLVADSSNAGSNSLQLNDTKKMVREYVAELLDSASAELKEFDAPVNMPNMSYDYNLEIVKGFVSDKTVTFSSTFYQYTGGAHGSTLFDNATFSMADGSKLTYNNMFIADSLPPLTELVKKNIFTQYFKPDGIPDMADALLVPIDSMQLPTTVPAYVFDGVFFIYQQYEIAPYAAGMPSCTIPYSEIAPFLTPEAAALVPKQK